MNCYETPTAITIGDAHDLILGIKPVMPSLDDDLQMDRANKISDIDETDD